MASNHTTNYQLNQWSAEDRVLRTEFNADNEKIDAALASLSAQTAAKASQEEVNGLKNVVSVKADKSALNALSASVEAKANQSEVNTLRSDMSAGDLWVKLAQTTSAADSTEVSLDLSGITFTDYWQIRIFIRTDCRRIMMVRFNHDAETIYYQYYIHTHSDYTRDYLTQVLGAADVPAVGTLVSHIPVSGAFPGFFCEMNTVAGGSYSNQFSVYSGCTWENLTSLQINAYGSTIPAGAEILVLGLKG